MEQNAAVVNARNAGSKETKGEYIPLYGPDDPWVGGKLDPQFALAEKDLLMVNDKYRFWSNSK